MYMVLLDSSHTYYGCSFGLIGRVTFWHGLSPLSGGFACVSGVPLPRGIVDRAPAWRAFAVRWAVPSIAHCPGNVTGFSAYSLLIPESILGKPLEY